MKSDNQSSARIMVRNVMGLVTSITLVLGLLIVFAVGHQLLEQVSVNTAHVVTSLKKRVIDGNDDWENWRRNSTLDTSSSRVRVLNMRKDARRRYYYSPYTRTLLAQQPLKVPLIQHLYYRPGKGLFYHQTGHAKGIRYDVWQRMDSEVEVLGRVVEVTIVLLVLTLIISPIYIRRLSHRLTDPLAKLSQATKTTGGVGNDKAPTQLPVPERPTEVTALAQNFNGLLAQLQERQEQQKLFVMNAAHELRTPIATIRSHAQLMERHGREHPEIIDKSVHYIIAESRQMQQLINELLALSHADQDPVTIGPIDLSTALTQVVAAQADSFHQQIVTAIAPNIYVNGTVAAITHIVNNLVANAAKYSPQDSSIRVELRLVGAQRCVLAVTDTGLGISDADKPHIFERFYRSADVRGSIDGTGLGLAIVAQLTQVLGGQLRVMDNQPQGTCMQLELPVVVPAK